MDRNFTLVAATLAVAVSLAGCGERDRSPQTTATRAVEPFEAIELRGAANIDVAIGGAQSLQLEGSERALERVRTEVRGQRLVIDSKRSWWQPASTALRVHVTVPRLVGATVAGAGELTFTGVAGGDFELSLSGAGNATGTGQVDRLQIEMNGAGNVDFTRVTAGDTRVEVNGAGNVEVTTTAALRATMNGVGTIRYGGPPSHVESEVNGVGSIRAR